MGGVGALGGHGKEVKIRGTWFLGSKELRGHPTGQSRGRARSVGGVASVGGVSFAGRSGPARSGVGSVTTCEAGGFNTVSGLGGRGAASKIGTGRRSKGRASYSIAMLNQASCRQEAITETFLLVLRRSTSRVEVSCNGEKIVHRTS